MTVLLLIIGALLIFLLLPRIMARTENFFPVKEAP